MEVQGHVRCDLLEIGFQGSVWGDKEELLETSTYEAVEPVFFFKTFLFLIVCM